MGDGSWNQGNQETAAEHQADEARNRLHDAAQPVHEDIRNLGGFKIHFEEGIGAYYVADGKSSLRQLAHTLAERNPDPAEIGGVLSKQSNFIKETKDLNPNLHLSENDNIPKGAKVTLPAHLI